MQYRRKRLTLLSGSCLLAAGALGGCADTSPPRGGLMLMVSSDGPLLLDRLQIEVSAQDQSLLSNSYRVPEEVSLPTTAAIVSNGDATAQAKISVIGWSSGVPLDRRDTIISQIPTDRVAALHVVLSARCSGKLSVSSDGAVESSCGDGNTCDNRGNCVPAEVRATELPSYREGDENNGSGGAGSGSPATGDGGEGEKGDAGAGGSSSETCAGMRCETPPPTRCLSDSQLRGYEPSGTCSGGKCIYASRVIDCECEDDACTRDPCASVTCEDSVCVLGTCQGVCAPPQTRCQGSLPQTCSANGSWHDEPMSAGQCDAECTPDTTQCDGLSKQQTCDEAGEWAPAVECVEQTCVGSGPGSACGGVCAQGQTKCSGADQQNCGVMGSWSKPAACVTPRACQNGACACPASVPDECNDNCTNYQTDKFNCGRCGHSCQGGTCVGGACQPLKLSGGAPVNIAVSNGTVYWTDSSGVMSSPANGSSTLPPFTSFGATCVTGLALDATSIYGIARDSCTGLGIGSLMKAPLSGGAAVKINTSSLGPSIPPQSWRCLAVDATNVYYANYDTNELFRVPVVGGPATRMWQGTAWPQGVAVQGANIFWSTPTGIFTMPIAGGSSSTIAPAADGKFLAVDASYVYYVHAGALMKTLISGSTPITLVASGAAGSLALDANNIYYLGTSTVMMVPKLGGAPRTLASDQSSLRDIAVDAKNVYWTTSTAVMKVAL